LEPDNPAGHMGWPSQRIAPVDQSFDRTHRGVGLLAVAVAMGVVYALIRTRSFGCLPTLRG
jgi:hypothetical protein